MLLSPFAASAESAFALLSLGHRCARVTSAPPDSELDLLLNAMLIDSDNSAANALLSWIGGSETGGAAEVNERGDKYILLLNDRIIDGHHHLAKAERGKITRSLPVLDLSPLRHQAAAEKTGEP